MTAPWKATLRCCLSPSPANGDLKKKLIERLYAEKCKPVLLPFQCLTQSLEVIIPILKTKEKAVHTENQSFFLKPPES